MGADKELRSTEKGSYGLLFVNNPLPMWVFEIASGRFLAVNAEACRHYGYSEAEFLRMTISDIRPAEEAPRLSAMRSREPAGHRSVGVWHHRKKSGEIRDVEITSDDIVFEGKQARLVLANDITEKIKAAEASRERDERFQYVARATNDAVWDWDLVNDTVWWNEGLERLFGHAHDEIRNIAEWRACLHPDDGVYIMDGLRAAIAGKADQWSSEHRFLRRDQSFAFVYNRAFLIRDVAGRGVRVVGAMTDLSERKATEDKLREQAMLLDLAQDAIIVTDLDHRIRYSNSAAARLYGVPREQMLGRPIGEVVVPDAAIFNEAHATVLATGEWSGRLRQALAGGRTIVVDGHWTLLRDWAGEPRGVLKINTDVTERDDLRQRLAQSQKLEAVGQLTGGIAHDFNNLLTVIIGNSEMLAEELSQSDPHLASLATMITSAGERGAELTNRLLAFARRQVLEPVNVHPDELIDGMRGLLRRSLGENVELEVKHGKSLSPVSIDPAQFESSLLNLCINARDAMSTGGRIMIETSNVILDEAYASQHADVIPGAYVLIAVSDTGSGMTSETVARAFDPFFTTKAKGKGTGLGLSMVYGFTKQSGGHVAIYSEVGLGSVVKLYLPRTDATSDPPEIETPLGVDHEGGETVLLVEDDDLVRAHAFHLLEQLGYRVVAASNGPEALALLRTNVHVDLLFTDVIMPGGMNGPQLAEEAHELLPGLPVLYTSGYTENAIVHHGRLDPGVNLLHKPYRRNALAAKILTTLNSARTLHNRKNDG